MQYSTNELEILRVVWAFSKNYLYVAEFEIVKDHKALLLVLNARQSNKTMHSRLTCWVNRLLPFNFKVKHIPGKEMGITDLFLALPWRKAHLSSHYGNELVEATVNKILEKFVVNSDVKKKNCIKNDLLVDKPVDVYSLSSINNLDCINPMVGKNEKLQHIQRSFFASVLNYVTDTANLQFWSFTFRVTNV